MPKRKKSIAQSNAPQAKKHHIEPSTAADVDKKNIEDPKKQKQQKKQQQALVAEKDSPRGKKKAEEEPKNKKSTLWDEDDDEPQVNLHKACFPSLPSS